MAKLSDYLKLGQSIWLDDIRRSYFSTGELGQLVQAGLRGLTSNPSILEKAIAGSAEYDAEMRRLVREGKPVQEIYEALAIADIRQAADLLLPVYEQSQGADGYVSLEVNPKLAYDSSGTIAEARRLFQSVNRPNLMIKIPATAQGFTAIIATLGSGINVNVTLIFSVRQYQAAMDAYLSGLEKLAAAGGDLRRVASVASFFVSRLDTALDPQLQALGESSLLGKLAVANSKLAYACYQEVISTPRWKKLAEQGARVQRPLWASTSTKNPAYPDTLYIDTLIGPDTVNTLPPAALQAALDHGVVQRTIDSQVEAARAQMQRLAELGIDLEAVTSRLEQEGVAAFAKAFEGLQASITEKRSRMLEDR